MTQDEREWIVNTVTLAIVEARREMLEKDIPVLINWHERGCPIGRRMAMLLGGVIVAQVVFTVGVAVLIKLL